MIRWRTAWIFAAIGAWAAACGSSDSVQAPLLDAGIDAGEAGADVQASTDAADGPGGYDGAAEAGGDGGDGSLSDAGADVDAATALTNIKHVVVIVQENHTFDSYFGRWCTATVGSNPTCTTGPSCCEAAPTTDPSGASPLVLDDVENATWDPNHSQVAELEEMHGGAMDRYVTGTGFSNAKNFAIATTIVQPYHDWAAQYALADRYFQPLVGESTANDMYFAVAKYVFTDNAFQPNTNGHGCTLPPTPTTSYTGQTTIADVLLGHGHSFAFYIEGYARMLAALLCPSAPSDCPANIPAIPCDYSPGDVPFQFYTQFADNPLYMKDLDALAADVAASKLRRSRS
jgi:phospholipase C